MCVRAYDWVPLIPRSPPPNADPSLHRYRLEYDMSWTLKDNILEREKRRTFDSNLLGLTNGQAADAAKTFAILDH